MKEKFNKLFLFFYVWAIGLPGGILFTLLVILGRVRIEGYKLKKLIPPKQGLIVIYNHPSLWEPVILPFLFFPFYLFSPKMIPFSAPDKKNYYDKLWFLPFRPVSIPIVREREGRYSSSKKLLQKIREGKIIILSPEGGRTFKGEEFKIIKDGKIVIETDWQKAKDEPLKIRRFQEGTESFLKRAQIILPIWVEGGEEVIPNKYSSRRFPYFPYLPLPRLWKRIKIKIGTPLENITSIEELEDILLKLGAV